MGSKVWMRQVWALWIILPILSAIGVSTAQTPGGTQQDVLKEVKIAEGAFTKGGGIPTWADLLTVRSSTSTAPYVIVHADTHFLVADSPSLLVHRAHKVNDASVLRDAGQWPLYFNPTYQKLVLHRLNILRGGQNLDRLANANIRFLQREGGLESGVYSGIVTCALLIEDVRVGDTIEIVYGIEGANPVMGGKYTDYASWDQGQAIELRRVTLNHPISRPVAWRFLAPNNSNTPKPIESVSAGIKRLRFQASNLPAVTGEPYAPPYTSVESTLQFSEFKSWEEVTQWASGLFQLSEPLTPELKAAAETIRSKTTPEERAAAALAYVQSEIRYFSVSLGESSHRPSPPSLTLQRRYGDCKDKSFMLVALLKELGIEAHPTLAALRTRHVFENLLPTPYAFDHAVVRMNINNKTYFVDPTRQAQRSKLEKIGQGLEGYDVLVVAPGTKELTRITNPDFAELEKTHLEEKVVIKKLGEEGTLSAKQIWHGNSAEFMRGLWGRMTKEQKEKFPVETYERRYPGIKLAKELLVEDDLEQNRFAMTALYNVPKLSVLSEGDWLVRFSPRNLSGYFYVPSSTERKLPLFIPSFPAASAYSFEAEFPPEVSVIRDPEIRLIKNKAFTYAVNNSFRGNNAKVTLEIKTLAQQLEAKEVPSFMEDARKVDSAVRSYVVVRKGDIKGTSFLGLKRKDVRETLQERLKDAVEKFSKTIQGNTLTGNDLADVYCSRAEAYADMGRVDEAIKDAAEAVKLSPNSANALRCRSSINFVAGEFQKGISDASKAIGLGAEPDIFRLRGRHKYYLGQYESALEDFQKNSALSGSDEDRLFTELWITLASMRLNKPSPDVVIAHAKKSPTGDWPRPAFAMLNGLMTPDEVMLQVNRKQGDERELNATEAYFYIGQYWIAKNDGVKAREFFEKAKAQGITMYVEHVASGFELQQLIAKK
jgi:lipoprotein NlpI